MGANSRKRKAARQQRTQERNEQPGERPTRAGESWDAARAHAVVEAHVHHALRLLSRKKLSDDEVARVAAHLVTRAAPHPRHVVEIVLHDLAHVVVGHVVDGGWSPSDLGELVTRNLGPGAPHAAGDDPARARAQQRTCPAMARRGRRTRRAVTRAGSRRARRCVARTGRPAQRRAPADRCDRRHCRAGGTRAPEARAGAGLARQGRVHRVRRGGRGVVGQGAGAHLALRAGPVARGRAGKRPQRPAGAAPLARQAVRAGPRRCWSRPWPRPTGAVRRVRTSSGSAWWSGLRPTSTRSSCW